MTEKREMTAPMTAVGAVVVTYYNTYYYTRIRGIFQPLGRENFSCSAGI